MALAFAGPATPLDDAAIAAAARKIGCDIAAVRAVIAVESLGSGFLPDGRPRILFERHYFSRLTGGRFDGSHPDISAPVRGGYKGGAAEHDRLARAIALDENAALRSASWGAFQIMGDNYRTCGFEDVRSFVAAHVSGEPAQLDAFVNFVRNTGLAAKLIRHDWAGFARGYNGPAYKANRYDEKLAAAWRRHSTRDQRRGQPLLASGAKGPAVARAQRALEIPPDGDFGPRTRAAVIAFQKRHGLAVDGIIGPATWKLLDA